MSFDRKTRLTAIRYKYRGSAAEARIVSGASIRFWFVFEGVRSDFESLQVWDTMCEINLEFCGDPKKGVAELASE